MNLALSATTSRRVLDALVIPDERLVPVSLTGTEGLSMIYTLSGLFKSEADDIDCQALLGQQIVLRLETQNRGERFVAGSIVRCLALGQDEDELWGYEIIIAPKAWHAMHAVDWRIWQHHDVQTIVEEVLSQHGVRTDWRLKGTYKTWEYQVQYGGESDLAFVSRLLEHEGIYYWFEHGPTTEVMVFGDHASTHEAFKGYADVPYYAPGPTYPPEDHISSLSLQREVVPGQTVMNDYDYLAPSADLYVNHADPRGHLFDQYQVRFHPGPYRQPQVPHGQQYAQARLELLQQPQEYIVLEGRVRGAAPGHRITVSGTAQKGARGAPKQAMNRELLITQVGYSIRNNQYLGRGADAGSRFDVTICAIPAERQYRPPLRTPVPRSYGPETAVVVGPEGAETHTNENGCIRVKFNWFRDSKNDGRDSCWMRYSSGWASRGFGMVFIPRVGDEIVVDYERGDVTRPIAMASLYHAENTHPWALPGNASQSGILTRSTPGGGPSNANAIRFEDKMGSEELWTHAEKDQRSEVENDESHWVGHDRKKVVDNDETTKIGRDRSELVGRNETIEIQGERKELVHLNETITIKQARTELVMWDESITIKKNRGEWVELNESIGVGQNRTMNIAKSESLTVGHHKKDRIGKNLSVKVGKTKTETIGMAYMQNVGLGRMENVGLAYLLNVGAYMNVAVGASLGEQIAFDQTTTVGRRIAITAGEELEIIVGKATFLMKADGTIAFNGHTFSVGTTGEQDYRAEEPITVQGKRIHDN